MAGRHVILSLGLLLMYINATFVLSKEEKSCVRGFRVCNKVSETMLRCGRGVRCITVYDPTTIVICQSPSTVVRVGSGAGISINGCKVEVLGKKTGVEREEEIIMKNTEESTETGEEAKEKATFAFRWSVATPPPCEEKETILDKLISAVAGITLTVITILVIRVVKRRQKVARRRVSLRTPHRPIMRRWTSTPNL
ncbi:Hypothetical predicted protein [Mytilus galloprovincialis]|nr:Hypothetical predicted protein [Mytilus galloprovincialis]